MALQASSSFYPSTGLSEGLEMNEGIWEGLGDR